MAVTIRFPDALHVPSQLPLLVTRPPRQQPELLSRLAEALGVAGDVRDAGSRLVIAGRTSSLEVFSASNSVRFLRTDLDGEGRDQGGGRISPDEAVEVAERFLDQLGRPEADVRYRSISELEALVIGPEDREPRSTTVGLQVNYRFSLDGITLVGPGAKAQVTVASDGGIFGAYCFWRDAAPEGELPTVDPSSAFRQFSAARLFAGLDDNTARVDLESVELGLYCSPPSEPQAFLFPAYVFRGTLPTELVPDHRFITYVPAATVDESDVKGLRLPHSPPSVFAA